jgi:hypothetical protein
MKLIKIFFAITFLAAGTVSAQPKEVKFLVDTSIAIMKVNAVNRDKVDWAKIEKDAYSLIDTVKNAYQLGPVYRMLFQSLNDFHGGFYCWDSTYNWHRQEPEYSDSIRNEWKKGVVLQKKILPGNIGYLRVPFMSFAERKKLDQNAQSLNDSLCALLSKNVSGIVLDLRLNGGGAMYPMMLGLEQLLHEGKIGSFTDDSTEWIIKDNSFRLDTMILTSIIPKCQAANQDIPVAVLIGPGTGSSGEFLAMSFKGRKNTIFIGTETAGYITATQGFKINDAASILLSVAYGRDRTGHVHDKALSPDIYINDPDSFNDIKNDKKVLAAIKWIKENRTGD